MTVNCDACTIKFLVTVNYNRKSRFGLRAYFTIVIYDPTIINYDSFMPLATVIMIVNNGHTVITIIKPSRVQATTRLLIHELVSYCGN
jgi:hypothetical protein